MLNLTIDPQQFQAIKELSATGKMRNAIVVAVNRTLRTGAAGTRREVARQENLPTRILGSGNRGMIGVETANFEKMAGLIKITNFNISLRNFRRLGRLRRGMTAALRAGGSQDEPLRLIDTHAFRNAQLGGGKPIFARYGAKRTMTKGKQKGKVRQPVYKLYGPSARKSVEQTPGMLQRIMGDLQETLRRNVDSQINRFMQRRKLSASEQA